jgi:alpha-tubulin suppressor-like RCC1 family protein
MNTNRIKISFKQISCGPNHGLLLSRDADIYAFGSIDFEQLGTDSFRNNSIPTKINIEKKFIEITANKDWET